MNTISNRWKAEFAGFCWGEAYIGVTRYFRRKKWGEDYWLFRGQVKINLRGDDLPLLKEFQSKLGGHIFKSGKRLVKGQDGKEYEQRQNYSWTVINHQELKRIADILNQSILPAKKQKSLEVLNKFLKIAHKKGIKYTKQEREELEKLRLESINATKFSE